MYVMYDSDVIREQDKNKVRLIKIVGLVLLLPTLYLVIIQFCGGPPTQAEIEKRISGSETLKGVDNLCKDLPKPPGFEFVSKVIAGNISRTAIGYYFRSRRQFDDVKKFYAEWAPQNNWRVDPSAAEPEAICCRFMREDQRFEVSQSQAIGVDYVIDCSVANKQ